MSAGAAVSTGVAASLAPTSSAAQREAHRSDPEVVADRAQAHGLERADAEVRALFGEALRESALVEGRWRIENLYGVRAGAIPLVMSSGELRFALEVFRASPVGPAPLSRAGELALFLVNRGDGRTETLEMAGLGVLALGRALAARVSAGAPIPRALRTHGERQARHPTGIFHVPV